MRKNIEQTGPLESRSEQGRSCWERLRYVVPLLAALGMAGEASAETVAGDAPVSGQATPLLGETEQFSIHGQWTYILQRKNNFSSPYYGQNSLTNKSEGGGEKSYTLSGTAFLGARPWKGGEVYYNPEMFQGIPFTGALVGLGGFQNGELQKGAYVPAIYYHARAFLKQTIGLGGDKDQLDSGPNQIGGAVDKNRIVLTYGKVTSLDFFDQNTYSHDPRTQFQNFSLWSMGAYGYAADSKGYTYGLVAEWFQDDFVVRAARLAVTTEPGGNRLDWTLRKNYVDTLELTRTHSAWGQPGAIRGLIYRQYANMGRYNDAISKGAALNGGLSPDNPAYEAIPLIAVRGFARSWGYGINGEQAITDDVGLFARWSWNPGKTETLTLDMSHSLSGGVSIKGKAWGRSNDVLGLGYAISGISTAEANYLGKGYYTVYMGDGNIQYRKERVAEAYYSAQLFKGLTISGDFQHIANPAFNGARGPVKFFGLRIHAEI